METSTKTYISCIYLLGLGVLHSGKTFNLIFKPTFVAGTKDKKNGKNPKYDRDWIKVQREKGK